MCPIKIEKKKAMVLIVRKEEGLAVDPTFNVTVVFGKRNEVITVISLD